MLYNQSKNDNALKAHAPLVRYSSMLAAGIKFSQFTCDQYELDELNKLTKVWKEKIKNALESAFKAKKNVWDTVGYKINVEMALEGEAECCKRRAPKAKGPLYFGINVSRDYNSANMLALRAGAILAVQSICAKAGRKMIIEVCYGNGLEAGKSNLCHVRIGLNNPTPDMLSRIACSHQTIRVIGKTCIDPIKGKRWCGYYRFHEFFAQVPGFPKEYDFVLDRIDTSCIKTEEKRIMDQLLAMDLV